jgi:hypothetical protein
MAFILSEVEGREIFSAFSSAQILKQVQDDQPATINFAPFRLRGKN